MVLIGVLIGLSVMGTGVLGGRNLARAADQLTLLFEDARQHALTSGCPTAAIILTGADPEADGRALTLLEYYPRTGWKQIRPWGFLPEGCCVEVGTNLTANTFVSAPDPAGGLPHANPNQSPVAFRGQPVANGHYAFRVFLPKGGVLTTSNGPIQIQVLEGRVENGVTKPQKESASSYRIFLIAATGRSKINYPGS